MPGVPFLRHELKEQEKTRRLKFLKDIRLWEWPEGGGGRRRIRERKDLLRAMQNSQGFFTNEGGEKEPGRCSGQQRRRGGQRGGGRQEELPTESVVLGKERLEWDALSTGGGKKSLAQKRGCGRKRKKGPVTQ